MKIGGRQIGRGAAPYVIAELGVNHDGSVARAVEMVDLAAAAGADAVKLQMFRAEMLMSGASRLAGYQAAAGEKDPVEMLRRLELSNEGLARVRARAQEKGVHAIVTVFSVELVGEAEMMGWDAYKTASPDVVHRPLLEALWGTGRPLIVSTGAATVEEVVRAVGWIQASNAPTGGGTAGRWHDRENNLALLQCVSCYPTPRDMAELGGIVALQKVFAGAVGYSDHTADRFMGASAAAMGACMLEKHFTYDTQAAGPDHAASLDPGEFAVYVAAAKNEWARVEEKMPLDEFDGYMEAARDGRALGEEFPVGKSVLGIEEDVRRVSRQSVVSRGAVAKGAVITREMVTFKRPGTGVEPFRVEEVVGKRAGRAIAGDVPILMEDLA